MTEIDLAKLLNELPHTVLTLGAVIVLWRKLQAAEARTQILIDRYDARLVEAVTALTRVNDALEARDE